MNRTRRPRRFRPVVEGKLEARALTTVSPSQFFPSGDVLEVWTDAPNYSPELPWYSSPFSEAGTVESGGITNDWTHNLTLTDNSSDNTTDVSSTWDQTSHETSTPDVGVSGDLSISNSYHFVETTNEDGSASFSVTLSTTYNSYGESAPTANTTVDEKTGYAYTYTVTYTGTIDSTGILTGTYTLQASGGDSLDMTNSINNGADTWGQSGSTDD